MCTVVFCVRPRDRSSCIFLWMRQSLRLCPLFFIIRNTFLTDKPTVKFVNMKWLYESKRSKEIDFYWSVPFKFRQINASNQHIVMYISLVCIYVCFDHQTIELWHASRYTWHSCWCVCCLQQGVVTTSWRKCYSWVERPKNWQNTKTKTKASNSTLLKKFLERKKSYLWVTNSNVNCC